MNYIKRIEPLKTALLVGMIEFFALLILPFLNLGILLNGFIDGFAAALLAIIAFNFIISKYIRFTMLIDNSSIELKKMDILIPPFVSGIFLAMLFFVQDRLVFSFRSQIINDLFTGFFATFVTMIVCIFLYNILAKFTKIRFGGVLSDGSFKIKKAEILKTSFFVAMFELFILPLISLFYILLKNLPFYIQFPLAGLLAGFIGSLIAAWIYNPLAKKIKGITLNLEK